MKKITVRRIDSLGRIVIPMEIRKELGIDINTELEIHTEGDEFIISKYTDFCLFCKKVITKRLINETKEAKQFSNISIIWNNNKISKTIDFYINLNVHY